MNLEREREGKRMQEKFSRVPMPQLCMRFLCRRKNLQIYNKKTLDIRRGINLAYILASVMYLYILSKVSKLSSKSRKI